MKPLTRVYGDPDMYEKEKESEKKIEQAESGRNLLVPGSVFGNTDGPGNALHY